MYKHIIAAVDGSDDSIRALEHANGLARASEARLTLVHAYPTTADIVGSSDYSTIVASRKERGQQVLDAMRARVEAGTGAVELVLREGPEADAIVEACEALEADLVVVGSRGLGAVQRLLLGSVSDRVAHLAGCPVLIVR